MPKPTTKKARPPPTPKAVKPWDVKPFPKVGDWAPSKLHRSVGLALDNWGGVESYFGSIFAAIIGTRTGSDAVIRAFGSVLTFRGRAEMLAAAAEVYYLKYPNSESKSKFKSVMEAALGFSPRRNEIAHGITGPYSWFVDGRKSNRYVLGPTHYATNKRSIVPAKKPSKTSHFLQPTYLYSSSELDYFAAEFKKLTDQAAALNDSVRAEYVERRQASPQKSDAPPHPQERDVGRSGREE